VSNNGNLTEAQKLLLQKFPHLPEDDPLVELAAWNASLEQKVDDFGSRLDIWTNAILKQTDLATQQNQLIVSQNLTLQETAKNNAALGQTLLQFKQGLSQLQQEFKTLKGTIEPHGNSLTSLSRKLDDLSLKLKSLETLKALTSKVDDLTRNLETLATSVSSLKTNLNSNRTALMLFGIFILAIQFMQVFAYKGLSENLESAIQGVRERSEWALTKLERLEKKR
jgi:DNA repair exonuclease SbcCD ATPase subunit